jgi:molecular chaperone DnaK
LNVSAKDLGTGKEQAIEIKSSSGLSETEVQKMVKDAEAHAAEDEAKRKLVDLRNQADQLVYQTEKMLSDHGDKVDASVRTEIEQAVNRVKDVQKGDDPNVIERAIKDLTTASYKVGEAVYKAAGAQAGGPGGPGGPQGGPMPGGPGGPGGAGPQGGEGKKDDDVIDAEYEVKK